MKLLCALLAAALPFIFVTRILWHQQRNQGCLHGGGIERAHQLGATAAGTGFSAR